MTLDPIVVVDCVYVVYQTGGDGCNLPVAQVIDEGKCYRYKDDAIQAVRCLSAETGGEFEVRTWEVCGG